MVLLCVTVIYKRVGCIVVGRDGFIYVALLFVLVQERSWAFTSFDEKKDPCLLLPTKVYWKYTPTIIRGQLLSFTSFDGKRKKTPAYNSLLRKYTPTKIRVFQSVLVEAPLTAVSTRGAFEGLRKQMGWAPMRRSSGTLYTSA